LMLDEPPLTVRMRGSAGFMGDSFAILQFEFRSLCRLRSQFLEHTQESYYIFTA